MFCDVKYWQVNRSIYLWKPQMTGILGYWDYYSVVVDYYCSDDFKSVVALVEL